MYWHLLAPQAVCTVGLAMLAFTLADHHLLAFFALTLSATSQASNPLEWGYVVKYTLLLSSQSECCASPLHPALT